MELESKPLVSICIPTLNGENFIKEAMDTALIQSYRPLEIIISDDNSIDKTKEIVKSYIGVTDIPIKYYNHDPSGMASNWNNCVQKSSGEYIKFLFQDDLIHTSCIEEMMEVAMKDAKIGLVFCRRKILFDPLNPLHQNWVSMCSDVHKHWTKLSAIQDGTVLLKDIKLFEAPQNKVGEPVATLIKKEVFDKIGLFNNNLVQITDYEFYYRVFTKFKIGFIDKELATFRLHNRQASFNNNLMEIHDYALFPYLVYQNCYDFVHWKFKLKLRLKYDPLFSIPLKIFKKLRASLIFNQ